jgi:hypothetical protein
MRYKHPVKQILISTRSSCGSLCQDQCQWAMGRAQRAHQPVYNHDGSVNCFLRHDRAGAARKLLPLLFPLLEGFVFAVAVAVALAVAFV